MPDITMPTELFKSLEGIFDRLGKIDAKVEGCCTGIQEVKEYQRVQNGRVSETMRDIAELKRTNLNEDRGRERTTRTWASADRIVIILLTIAIISISIVGLFRPV